MTILDAENSLKGLNGDLTEWFSKNEEIINIWKNEY